MKKTIELELSAINARLAAYGRAYRYGYTWVKTSKSIYSKTTAGEVLEVFEVAKPSELITVLKVIQFAWKNENKNGTR